MKFEAIGQGNQITPTNSAVEIQSAAFIDSIETQNDVPQQSHLNLDTETKIALDQATGLMQNITSDKITNEVIRKMPSDEYLHLLKLLDNIIAGSVNKQI